MAFSATFLPEFDQEMANTRKMLERVPEDKYDWKTHPKSMPLGRLAVHVAEMPGWSKETMKLEELDIAPTSGPGYQPVIPQSRQQILDLFDKNIGAAREAISGAKDEDFAKPWSLLAGGNNIFTMPRAGVLRSMVLNHVIHHRAQLGVYLRLLDVPIPGCYGPSADEM